MLMFEVTLQKKLKLISVQLNHCSSINDESYYVNSDFFYSVHYLKRLEVSVLLVDSSTDALGIKIFLAKL